MRMRFAAAIVTGIAFALPAFAADPSIEITQAWARASPPGATTGAAYVTIVNHGTTADQLTGAATPVATLAEPHETIADNGVMKMRPLKGLSIAPGASVTFKPGGDHVMLTGLKQPLKAGEQFPLTLTFQNAGPIQTQVMVARLGAAGAQDHGSMQGMGMPGTNMPASGMQGTNMPASGMPSSNMQGSGMPGMKQ